MKRKQLDKLRKKLEEMEDLSKKVGTDRKLLRSQLSFGKISLQRLPNTGGPLQKIRRHSARSLEEIDRRLWRWPVFFVGLGRLAIELRVSAFLDAAVRPAPLALGLPLPEIVFSEPPALSSLSASRLVLLRLRCFYSSLLSPGSDP